LEGSTFIPSLEIKWPKYKKILALRIHIYWVFKSPQNQHDVRSFLGLNGYYRKYVKGYAKIATPLNRLLTKDISFKWTND
jgi:hypothetical protein